MSEVLVARADAVVRLTLNRPDRLNAVNEALYGQLMEHLSVADADPGVRAVVLTGQGRAFCVGADLKAHSAGTRSQADLAAYVDLGQRVCERIQTMATPVIAAVRGYALGAGAELAVSADFLLVAEDAMMGFPEVSIGTFVGGGVTHRLPRLVGLRRATELLIVGERFTGRQALAWGLATAAPRAEDLDEAADELAHRLARKAPLPLARMKAALNRSASLGDALGDEATDLLAMMQTEDWAEGVAAFAERREPVFQGR
ncbi:enoyl-CoA hydratase/isomerase family protein [Rugosimonospora africana]|uniref:3-hydroxybutyryl-CoA dehydratase n=1 Tax=Rugosimonospora africana TaxID=556532 RepID=A0A8J3VV37_9ACTN|nr:enoyl-CoA hydratase/isomerase family protein [Rugosimonospora africana]GIH19524.1 3-hydroxybutyryl-CoA dehydratase [Rugosimonospora africana]